MTSARDFGLNIVRSSGDEEYLLCPFHNDHSTSASFNRSKGLFYCYVCNLGLNAVQLATRLNLEVDLEELRDEQTEPPDYQLLVDAPVHEEGIKMYHPYFAQRGISESIIQRYGVTWKSWNPDGAVFPITNLRGQIVGSQVRYRHPEEAGTRYKKMGETQPLWPMHHLTMHREKARIIFVCEGGWSAMRIATAYDNVGKSVHSLALLGAKANEAIVDVLRDWDIVIFFYDGDEAGIRACRKMRKLFPLAYSWTLPTAPDDMTDKELEELFAKLEKNIT